MHPSSGRHAPTGDAKSEMRTDDSRATEGTPPTTYQYGLALEGAYDLPRKAADVVAGECALLGVAADGGRALAIGGARNE